MPNQLFLEKCGFASSTPRAIVYASRKSDGLGFQHLYAEQGIAHVVKLIQTLCTPYEANQLTKTTLSWWHANAGIGFDLLSDPQTPVHHLEGTWLTSTRLFLQSIHASINFSFQLHSPIYRIHDCNIVDKVSSCLPYGCHGLRLLNFCRLHLQVSGLSKLTNAAGTHLIQNSGALTPANVSLPPPIDIPNNHPPHPRPGLSGNLPFALPPVTRDLPV